LARVALSKSPDTPQTNGQALTVEQRDAAGNLSAAVDCRHRIPGTR
jgi:hypothetical protein